MDQQETDTIQQEAMRQLLSHAQSRQERAANRAHNTQHFARMVQGRVSALLERLQALQSMALQARTNADAAEDHLKDVRVNFDLLRESVTKDNYNLAVDFAHAVRRHAEDVERSHSFNVEIDSDSLRLLDGGKS